MIQAGAMNSYIKSNTGPLLEAADRQRHLEGSSCGRVQITGAAQWTTPIMRTSAIYHTRVTPC